MFNIQHYYKCRRICHLCRADKDSYMVAPSILSTQYRHDKASLLQEALRPGPSSCANYINRTIYSVRSFVQIELLMFIYLVFKVEFQYLWPTSLAVLMHLRSSYWATWFRSRCGKVLLHAYRQFGGGPMGGRVNLPSLIGWILSPTNLEWCHWSCKACHCTSGLQTLGQIA